MPHPCKANFWGGTAPLYIEWIDWLETFGPQPVRTLTQETWMSVCVLQHELERATGIPSITPPVWIGGGGFEEADDSTFRVLTHTLLGLLVADERDTVGPNPHTPSVPGWMATGGGGNPDPDAMDALIGGMGPSPKPDSLLGRVRSALGSF
jgi:hypothetical protein